MLLSIHCLLLRIGVILGPVHHALRGLVCMLPLCLDGLLRVGRELALPLALAAALLGEGVLLVVFVVCVCFCPSVSLA